jgi:4-hydroxymandelate oxidase
VVLNRRSALKAGFAFGASSLLTSRAAGGITAGQESPAEKAPPPTLLTLEDYERAARERIDPVAWEFLSSGAADEITVRWNIDAYRAIRLVPRQLRDVGTLDLSTTLLGRKLAHPILLAPVACHTLMHADGELGTARGARSAGAGLVLSSYTTIPIEQVAAEKPPMLWFQLYVQERGYTEALIRRAVSAGATAIAVTIDTPTAGARNRQDRAGFTFPPNLPHVSTSRPEHPLQWKDLEWIQRAAGIPIFLKGLLHPDDAELAVKAGAAGIMVSNHGGRNLDTALPTIEALPAIVDKVAGRIPVIVDGGIRRGTDVLKAMANGASAVMIGRPYVHGLAVNGAAGVEAVIGILRHELELAMALSGTPSITAAKRSILRSSCQRA